MLCVINYLRNSKPRHNGFTHIRTVTIKKRENNQSCWECGETWTLGDCWRENKMTRPVYKIVGGIVKTLKRITLSFDLHFWDCTLQKINKSKVLKKRQKQPKYSLMDEEISQVRPNRVWLCLQRQRILSQATTCAIKALMNLEASHKRTNTVWDTCGCVLAQWGLSLWRHGL